MNTPVTDGQGRRVVWTAAAVSALLIAQQVAGRATRDALFLTSFPVTVLPGVMMAAAIASIAAVFAWSRLLGRRSPLDVMPWAAALAAAFLALEFAVSVGSPRLAAILLYMHMALLGPTLVSGFWSVVNERFDPYSAKAAVGRIAAGASVGGIAGGLLALGASRVLPAAALLLVMAALMVGAAVGLRRLAAGRAPAVIGPAAPGPSAVATLRSVSYLRDVGIVVTLGALTESLLEYVLKAQAASALREESQFLTLFALLNTAQSLLSLGVQAAFTRPSLSVLGISGTVAVRPVVTLALALVGLVDPRMWAGALARLSHEVSSNSLFRSGYELLYTPLSEAEKRPTKSVIDVGFDKVGSLAGGAVVLWVASLAPSASVRILFALSALLCVAAVALTGRLQRGYVASLEQSLRAGKVRLDPDEIADEATRHTLAQTSLALDREKLLRDIAAFRTNAASAGDDRSEDAALRLIGDLRSGDAERVRRVVRGVPQPEAALVPHLIALLARDDLFLEILRPLRRAASLVTGQLVDALLDARQPPVVRRRVARALKGSDSQRAVDGLLAGLDDPRLEVRAECAMALVAITIRRAELSISSAAVFGAARRELERSDGEAVPDVLQHVFTLLSLVLEREPLRIAWWALRAGDPGLRGTALEYLDNVLPDVLRAALWPRLGEWGPERRPSRPRQVVVDDLLRSSESIDLGRAFLTSVRRPQE
jgi:ATP:ADP antiporter, AAA family